MDFWQNIGSPQYVVSPMVDSSEYAFRQLSRQYGAQICYTPMIHAKMFMNDVTYRKQRFDNYCPESLLVAQFAGDDPKVLLTAAQIVEKEVVAVDLNCGCPQPIARKGHYGASLLREPELVCEVVRCWSNNLSCAVSCKVRIIDEGSADFTKNGLPATIRLVKEIEAAGATFITVHGRTRHMSGKHTGVANWDSIAAIKRSVSIPVIANGNIERFADIARCREYTGCDAVMSAEAVLENPALFSGRHVSSIQLAREYLTLASKYPPYDFHKCTKAHVVRMIYGPLTLYMKQQHNNGLTSGNSIQSIFANCKTITELNNALDLLEQNIVALCIAKRKDNLNIQTATTQTIHWHINNCMINSGINNVGPVDETKSEMSTLDTLQCNDGYSDNCHSHNVTSNSDCTNESITDTNTIGNNDCDTSDCNVMHDSSFETISNLDNLDAFLQYSREQCSWYRRHRVLDSVVDTNVSRECRKAAQRVWIEGKLRFNK